MGLLFVEGIEAGVEVEEICIPGTGWVGIFTEEAREYLRNRDEDELEDECQVVPGFDSEAGIEAFLAANPDNLEVIPEGAKHYPSWTDKEWDSAIKAGDLTHLFEGGI